MAKRPPITDLLSQVETNPDAAAQIVALFWERARDAATKRLSLEVRQRISGSDVAQSVMRSLYSDLHHGRTSPQDSNEFERILLRRIRNRAISAARGGGAEKRDVRRSVSAPDDLMGKSRTPLEEAILAEESARAVAFLEREEHPVRLSIRQLHFFGGLSATELHNVLLEQYPHDEVPAIRTIQLYLQRTWQDLTQEFRPEEGDDA